VSKWRMYQMSMVAVCIDWMYSAMTSTDVNWTAEFCFRWTRSVERFVTSAVRRHSTVSQTGTGNAPVPATTMNVIRRRCDVSVTLLSL